MGHDTGQDNPDRSVWTGWPHRIGQAGQDREDGMPGHDNKDWTVGTGGELWTKKMFINIFAKMFGIPTFL
jgi:hypothetical protein